MKHFIKKTTLSVIAMIAAFSVMAPTVFAGYYDQPTSLNQHPADCPTVMIANHTTQEGVGSTCWATSISTVQPGQIFNVMVYYHNTGYSTAHDVRVKLNAPSGPISSFTFSGSVTDSEGDSDTGSVSVNISGTRSLEFGSVRWYPDHQTANYRSFLYGQTGSEIFSGSGLRLGDLGPDLNSGYSNQGTVIVSFKVVDNGSCSNCNGDLPLVDTWNYSSLNNDRGDVTLRGYYDANGYDTETWFEYRRNNGSWVTTGNQDHSASSEGQISRSLSGLSTGSYEYRAVAENAAGIKRGSIVSFEIDRNDNSCDNGCDNSDDSLDVSTRAAEDIDEDSAVLVGYIDDIGSGDVERWFEWDSSRSDVEDGDGRVVEISGSTNSTSEFSKRISGLNSDRTYYFRACAEDDNGDRDCGSVRSFTTDDTQSSNNGEDLPSITTLAPISIGSTTATVNGYYDANGCGVTTYFEYGRTNSLGSRTNSVYQGDRSGSMVYSFTSLATNTTYYYRAVGSNCEGTTRGTIRSFTTQSNTVVNPPVVITTGGGSGNSFIKLMIDNHREIVRSGSEISYDVSWENITSRRLEDLILEINFPEEMTVIDTDRGEITRDGHSVVYEISELTSRDSGEMTITTEIGRGLSEGDPVVARAIMAFENPTTQATENAIAYDSDEFGVRDGSVLGASLFGLGFLPGSLAGWLLIILILLIIAILVRYVLNHNKQPNVVVAQPQAQPNTGTTGDDYIVYRPTPKQ